ncbi:DUF3293 domain-containing protein [Dyella sp. C9]|uniref:DUF3293 domain-containing protein n=1 Tax=Dyella sp. C9 TaxID=2202154 RepID=UPI000DEED504|nr:DUF3293 domain-containing protein [Dyella sp. C9]
MDEALLAAFRRTDYRVRLAEGGWASIRIDQPLPPRLLSRLDGRPWAFITAWNPRSERVPRGRNRQAQHRLLAALRELGGGIAIHPALGVAEDGQWREPSLFVVGADTAHVDPLARQFGQHAYVYGTATSPARLRRLDEA